MKDSTYQPYEPYEPYKHSNESQAEECTLSHINARGLGERNQSKLKTLKQYVKAEGHLLLAVTETQTLKYFEEDEEYYIFGSKYQENKSGGVLLIINKEQAANAQQIFPGHEERTSVVAMIHLRTKPCRRVIVVAHYARPQRSDNSINELLQSLSQRNPEDAIILLGDFNRGMTRMQGFCRRHNLTIARPRRCQGWYTRRQKVGQGYQQSEIDYIAANRELTEL